MKNKLNAIIIDDKDDGKCISRLLKKEFPEFEVHLQKSGILFEPDYFSKNSPDILFVDIQYFDDKSEEILMKLKENDFPVILVTESEKSAIQAIKKGFIRYVFKPLKNLDFVLTVNKALEKFRKNKASHSAGSQNKINLPTLQGFKRVNIDEIIRCEADSNYTSIYLSDKSKVMVSKTLCDFEKNLSEYNFFRIHHKHLINLEHLKEYIKGKGGQVVMADNSVLDVSIRKKNEFLHKMA
ncbi:LytTR family transcriptional regulator DNA-binding domain-containing protein [Chryseobacterium gambrini]|uniref:LytTR family transcriptional regulator DNA-binding domain-containing protein n=1 Tax=Chryseobacterium gambrini TaxID=373672 RepID=A0AAJ1R669_9FLAO|nr:MULTISPECIES: LytTR family DNA-binding domain-containing protein [Chryseobacterium]MDN4014685.1 LytTR family transcriptional regulator DNA-binding domain-containing protein [Chryseobacterium gambrini]MDN4031948.1 LytTR family transcriptional regulator DNA-binding domain-containing protein [Chryseobacterium gambrini]QWA39434.1 LytTR family transcriptional regulator DNA-binding domain-containing protein [Chryseobacterium sp. ZHDP1]